MFVRFVLPSLACILAGCSQHAPSWDSLISAKISEHYPAYTVLAPQAGQLRVLRPGQADSVIEVTPIAQFCQRGPADCNYALDLGLITFLVRDALRVKKVMREAQNAAGLEPGKVLQRCAWPFWPQPGGNVVKTAPLVVALLTQPARLGVVARLDWRCFSHIRTRTRNVIRPLLLELRGAQ